METEGNTWVTRAGRPVEKPVSDRERKKSRDITRSGDGKRRGDPS